MSTRAPEAVHGVAVHLTTPCTSTPDCPASTSAGLRLRGRWETWTPAAPRARVPFWYVSLHTGMVVLASSAFSYARLYGFKV